MKDFEFHLRQGKVRKVAKDPSLARSLSKNLRSRGEMALALDTKTYAMFVFENLYDCLREICDALLAMDGYKTYSHEAAIAYLRKKGVPDGIVAQIDRYRRRRNASKYYGKTVSAEDAEDIRGFYIKHSPQLLELLEAKSATK